MKLAVAGFGAQTGSNCPATLADAGKALWLQHPAPHDRQNDRRHDADEEHIAPAIRTDEAIGQGADEGAERTAGHHCRGDLRPMRLAAGLGQQRNPDHQLRPHAEAGDKAIDGKIKDALRKPLQLGEHTVDRDAEGERAHPADINRR